MPANNQSVNPPDATFTVRVDPAEIEAIDLAAKVDVPPAPLPVAGRPRVADPTEPSATAPPAPRNGPAARGAGQGGVGRGRGAAAARRHAFRRS